MKKILMLCIGIAVLWGCQKEDNLLLGEEPAFIGSRAPGDYLFAQFYAPYSGFDFSGNKCALNQDQEKHFRSEFDYVIPASSPVWYKIWDEFRLRQVKIEIGIDKTLNKDSMSYYQQGTIFFAEEYFEVDKSFYFQHELLHVVQDLVLGYNMDLAAGMRNYEYEVAIVLDILNVFKRKSMLEDPREYFGRPAGEAGESYDEFMEEIVQSSIEGRLMLSGPGIFQFHAWIKDWEGYKNSDYQVSFMPRLVMYIINILFG
ncbi:hypothetical protein AALK14_01015 [Butyricimonas hominis]|uniref:hypothetical protein n=1 Tax=Butyricimonas TaxID=574697 RepID=UPI003517F717